MGWDGMGGKEMGQGKNTLRNEVIHHLAKRKPVNRIEHEDLARPQRSPQLIDEPIIPSPLATRSIEREAVAGANVQDRYAVAHHAPLWWLDDVAIAEPEQDTEAENEDEKGQEVSGPEADVEFEEGGEHCAEGADINTHVEDRKDLLHRQRMTNQLFLAVSIFPFPFCCLYVVGSESNLLRDKWADIRFNPACTQSNHSHGEYQAYRLGAGYEAKTARKQHGYAHHVDHTEISNRPKLPHPLISHDGPE